MRELQTRAGAAIILITHDLGVVAEFADDVVVMYAGTIVEREPVERCSTTRSIPTPRACSPASRGCTAAGPHLATIPGSPPTLAKPPPGCRFAACCPFVSEADP